MEPRVFANNNHTETRLIIEPFREYSALDPNWWIEFPSKEGFDARHLHNVLKCFHDLEAEVEKLIGLFNEYK